MARAIQDIQAERSFYDELFARNPQNEHITEGYDELHAVAFPERTDGWVLDVGCGTGGHAVRLARRGLDVIAVDLTLTGVRAARERFSKEGLHGMFVVANAEELPFKDEFASVTWAALLLHHFPKPDRLIAELVRVTRDRLATFEPNAGNLLTWLAMNVVNRIWGISAMTKNQVAHRAGRLRRQFDRHSFEAETLRYVHRPWGDRMGIVRRAYGALTAWLPERFRANKFLIVFRRRPA